MRRRGDERIPSILDDVCEQLFRATFVAEDGLRHFSHGVNVRKVDGSLEVVGYTKYPTTAGAGIALLDFFDWHLERHPDPEKQKIRDEVCQTSAAYVLANGTMPKALNSENDIFALAPDLITVPSYLFNALKGDIKNFDVKDTTVVQRRINDRARHEKGRFYSVEKAGERTFAGFKLEPRAIVHGMDGTLPEVDFDKAKKYDVDERVVVEIMDIHHDPDRAFKVSGR